MAAQESTLQGFNSFTVNPRRRFQGDHGAYLAVLMMAAMTFSLLSALSLPKAKGLCLAVMEVKNAAGTPAGKVFLDVWGWHSTGASSIHSGLRPINQHYTSTFKTIPEAYGQLAGAVQLIPKSMVIAMGIMPIIANICILVTFITAAAASYFYHRQHRFCHSLSRVATGLCSQATLWCLISVAMYGATYAQLKRGVKTQHLQGALTLKAGSAIWLMMAATIVTLYAVLSRIAWHVDEKRGGWVPPAWYTVTRGNVVKSTVEQVDPSQKAKEAEGDIAARKGNEGEDGMHFQGTPAPAYHDVVARRLSEQGAIKVTSEHVV